MQCVFWEMRLDITKIYMYEWKKWEIKILLKNDFPEGLKNISNPPDKLYYRGTWKNGIFEKSMAIVGSRRMTRYGKEVIEKFVPSIVAEKITIISGFMYGVDTESHRQCLECGGKTVAVVGGGLNILAPVENDGLYTKILESDGIMISEYEPDFKPTIWSFPQRDRLMSALSTLGVLIIEGGIKSGSLITAKYALKQQRKVLAIPGPINSSVSEGTNWLIKSGAAKMVTEIGDLLTDCKRGPIQQGMFKDYADLSKTERLIVGILENEAVTADEMCRKIGCSITEVSTAISMMLMRDLIEEENGKIYLS
jgi:DNA processing protein